jgi:hypothetical protein
MTVTLRVTAKLAEIRNSIGYFRKSNSNKPAVSYDTPLTVSVVPARTKVKNVVALTVGKTKV